MAASFGHQPGSVSNTASVGEHSGWTGRRSRRSEIDALEQRLYGPRSTKRAGASVPTPRTCITELRRVGVTLQLTAFGIPRGRIRWLPVQPHSAHITTRGFRGRSPRCARASPPERNSFVDYSGNKPQIVDLDWRGDGGRLFVAVLGAIETIHLRRSDAQRKGHGLHRPATTRARAPRPVSQSDRPRSTQERRQSLLSL